MKKEFKKKLATLVFCFVGLITNAQTHNVSGLVKNSKNEGVPFATVVLHLQKDTSIIKVENATENGGFKIMNIKPGQYFLSISSVGYQKYFSQKIIIENESINFSEILLKDIGSLKEIQVTAKKPLVEVRADKTIFNIQSSISATGMTAFEVLRKAPGVTIDNNENVILAGKTGVRIYIDGKQSVLVGQDLNDFLKSLQASDIESIEIITQPSARYDAAGNAGIINIKLKKDLRFGTNGSLSTGYSFGRFGKNNNSISLNNRNRKVNVFGTYSNRLGKNWSFIDFYREQVNTVFDQKSTSIRDGLGQNAKMGLDYFINSKNTLGIILNGNFNENTMLTNSRTPIQPLGGLPKENRVLTSNNNTETSNYNVYLNTNYKFADTLGHEFNVDFDYGKYDSKRDIFQPNIYKNEDETSILSQNIYRMQTPTQIQVISAKIDYLQNVLSGKMAIGAKVSKVSTNNVFDFYNVIESKSVFNTVRSNTFTYNENIIAGYINYTKKVKKLDFQIGLRVENTISEGNLVSAKVTKDDKVSRNYTNLFPSAGLTYSKNQNNSYALTYSKRIERPSYQSLNPFEWQLDELTFQKGNAFLQPQYADNISLSHTYKYTLTTTLSYSYIKDFFAQITDTLNFDRNFLMERNIADQQVLNLGVSYPFDINKWWNVYASVEVYHTSFTSEDPKFSKVKANVLSLYGQNTFKLPNKFNFEVSGWFSSPGVWGGTYKTKSLGSLDLAIQKKVLNEKLSIRLAATDIFFTSPWRGNTQFGGIKIYGTGGYESRQVKLNLSYNFGNDKVKSARNRKLGLEDEKARIN